MRVVMLTQYLGGNGRGMIGGIARSMARRGAQVHIIAGRGIGETHPDSPVSASQRYADAGGTPVSISRVPFYNSHDTSALRRTATYASFSAASSIAARKQLAKADVVLVYGSPATAAAAALLAHRTRGTPYVLLVQDVWPDSVFASGFFREGLAHSAANHSLSRFVAAVYRSASSVVAISPGMRDLLVARGVEPARASYIYNWDYRSEERDHVTVPTRHPGDPLVLMYAGNIGRAQNLHAVIGAVRRCGPGVQLIIIGSGAEEPEICRRIADQGINNVTLRDHVSPDALNLLRSRAHLHLVSLADEPLFRVTLPSKLQSLMASGAPILAFAPGEASELVVRSGAGITCDPCDEDGLLAALESARRLDSSQLAAMGARGRRFYEQSMTEEVNGDRLYAALAAGADSR